MTPGHAILVFLPRLFWGVMFARRQRQLLGVNASNALFGVYAVFFRDGGSERSTQGISWTYRPAPPATIEALPCTAITA